MVNRVLIRIKVVQLLYSYFLSYKEFKVESPAENPSRDKKYGYELYMDLLLMILELSGIRVHDTERRLSPIHGLALNKHIHQNQLAKSLNSLTELREIIVKNRADLSDFDSVIPSIYEAISTLPAFKTYSRIKKPELKDDVSLWLSIFQNLIVKNPAFMAAARKNPRFTLAGFTRGTQAIERTLSEYGDNRSLLIQARNSLDYALDKAYELYLSLLALPIHICRAEELRLDNARHKFLPTDADLNPDMRFVESPFVKALTRNPEIAEFLESGKLSWDADDDLVSSLLQSITSSEIYTNYMANPGEHTLAEDAEFWRQLFRNIIISSDALDEALESKSVYWNDDLYVIGTFVLKTIRKFGTSQADGEDIAILPQFKDDEDRNFGPDLFMSAIKHYGEYKEMIDSFVNTTRWDSDRLAFMDIVIMITAVTELLDYPAIPIAVTLNEYIEIANAYSTPRSGAFINGILFSVINHLKEEGKLLKN